MYRSATHVYILICYPETSLNSFTSSHVFFYIVFRIFSILCHVTCRQWQFYFFSNLDFFYLFFLFWLLCVFRTSNIILNKSGERQHPPLVSHFRGNAFSFSLLTMMLLYITFIMLRYVPSIPTLLRGFFLKIINVCQILSKYYSAFVEMVIWFLFFSLLIQCITLSVLWILRHLHIPGINPTW